MEPGGGPPVMHRHPPGEPMERFARAAAALDAPTMADVLELATRHGVEMTGPIPSLAG